MLELNPRKRISVKTALKLDLFSEFEDNSPESDICRKFIVPDLDENQRLSVAEYRNAIYRDIARRYPENNYLFGESTNSKDWKISLLNKNARTSISDFSMTRSSRWLSGGRYNDTFYGSQSSKLSSNMCNPYKTELASSSRKTINSRRSCKNRPNYKCKIEYRFQRNRSVQIFLDARSQRLSSKGRNSCKGKKSNHQCHQCKEFK